MKRASLAIGAFSIGALSLLALTGCIETTSICVVTARESGQAENEMQRFLHAHAGSKYGDDFRFNCEALDSDVRDGLLTSGDLHTVSGTVDGRTVEIEFVRKSSQAAEDFIRDHSDVVDVVWGLGVGYVLRLEEVLDDEAQNEVYHAYAPRGLETLRAEIATWNDTDQWRWFLGPECGPTSGDCVPSFVATTAYTNTVCFDGAGLAELSPIDCSCRATAEGCAATSDCPDASICPQIFPFDPGKRDYSWSELLCTPELHGHLAVPRPDRSGTGLIAVYALMASGEIDGVSSPTASSVEPTLNWLRTFRTTQSVAFTDSGSAPCRQVRDDDDTLIGISNISAYRDIQEEASALGIPNKVTVGTLSTGVGYEPEASALIVHDDNDDTRLRKLGGSMLLDWWVSSGGRAEASQTSSVVIHSAGSTSNAGECSTDCVESWADIPFDTVPKLGLQQGFAASVCSEVPGSQGSDCSG